MGKLVRSLSHHLFCSSQTQNKKTRPNSTGFCSHTLPGLLHQDHLPHTSVAQRGQPIDVDSARDILGIPDKGMHSSGHPSLKERRDLGAKNIVYLESHVVIF